MSRWGSQGFFTSGYFLEDVEMDAPNILRTAERKKILSNIESLGLLSAAEKAGLSLSKVLPQPAPCACMRALCTISTKILPYMTVKQLS
jgi:hypothetical protein